MMLARLLLESPDLMLLDEPSNHLDIATTEWLESYLARQPVAMVVVSHDRYFLDKVVNKIWELHEGKITPYPGNYTQYWRLRTEQAKVLERQSERQEEKAEKLEAYIRKYGAGQRAKQAHDRERKLERLQRDEVETMRDVVGPVMRFDEVERSGDIVVEARNLSKAFDVAIVPQFERDGQPRGMRGGDRAQRSGQDDLDQDLDRPRETRLGRSRSSAIRFRLAITTRGCNRSIRARPSCGRSGPKTIPTGWKGTFATCWPASA